jgi:hypothetical protein
LVGNRLKGLAAVYLHEIELVAAGVPGGPLRLAPALRASSAQELLFEVARRDTNRHWAACLHERLGIGCGLDDRDTLLALADQAQVGDRFRRAVQLYGWLMLTATRPDNAFAWSTRHLGHLARTAYELA